MAKEIERKFLIRNEDWRRATTSKTPFRQAYIASMDDRSVRVRIKNDRDALLTIKVGLNALVRDEYEYAIPLADAEELLKAALGIVIEKTRYTVDYEGFVWEIDVFGGIYQGLTVAEVELSHEKDCPPPPAWLGREVTGDQRYSNQYLAMTDLSGELCHVLPA